MNADPPIWRDRLAGLFCALALGAALLTAPGRVWPQAAPPASAGPAPATRAQAPLPAPATGFKETITNPYGLMAMWDQGSLVTRGTLLFLLAMSVGSWYVIVVKLGEQRAALRQARALAGGFWAAGTTQESLGQLEAGSVFETVARAAIEAKAEHRGELTRNVDLNSWVAGSIQNALDQVHSRLQGGLALLATVGATSPFVGLFGTVWGIYQALTAIGVAGQASIDKVAGPVGEALIMTALGLAVAVPAVLGYNWLGRRNRVVFDGVRAFASELHARLIGRAPRAALPGQTGQP
jgi:biopolymer transport protein ExbB